MIVAHSKRGDTAKLESSLAHFANREPGRGSSKAASNRVIVSMSPTSRSSALAFLEPWIFVTALVEVS